MMSASCEKTNDAAATSTDNNGHDDNDTAPSTTNAAVSAVVAALEQSLVSGSSSERDTASLWVKLAHKMRGADDAESADDDDDVEDNDYDDCDEKNDNKKPRVVWIQRHPISKLECLCNAAQLDINVCSHALTHSLRLTHTHALRRMACGN